MAVTLSDLWHCAAMLSPTYALRRRWVPTAAVAGQGSRSRQVVSRVTLELGHGVAEQQQRPAVWYHKLVIASWTWNRDWSGRFWIRPWSLVCVFRIGNSNYLLTEAIFKYFKLKLISFVISFYWRLLYNNEQGWCKRKFENHFFVPAYHMQAIGLPMLGPCLPHAANMVADC